MFLARELRPKDANGLSDPVVQVNVLNQVQNTSVKYKTLNAVWDDLLIFQFRNCDKEEIEIGSIQISILDANSIQRAELIGNTHFDMAYIYAQKDHEVYRTWIGVLNTDSCACAVQGYLKCSITIIGPSDKMKVHDLKKEAQVERNHLTIGGKMENECVLMPPSVSTAASYVVTTVHCAEGLPPMDFNVIGKHGIDAFAAVTIGSNEPLKTKIRTVKGARHELNVVFNEELWCPVYTPSMTRSVSIALLDWDRVGSHDTVAQISVELKLVQELGSIGPCWYNLYGPPLGAFGDKAAKADMKLFPRRASTFRGRVLLSLRTEKECQKQERICNFKRKATAVPIEARPATCAYRLQAIVASGNEIPTFST